MESVRQELNIDKVDIETDYLVSGFLRDIKKNTATEKLFEIIPELVRVSCIKFYYLSEHFVECGESMEMNEDGTFVKNISYMTLIYNTSYGQHFINENSPFEYCWVFKVEGASGYVCIGITSAENIDVNKRFTTSETHDFYAYSNGGYKYDLLKKAGIAWGNGFVADDFVKMIVNPLEKTIEYCVSTDEDFEYLTSYVKIENINFKDKAYRMVVSIGWPGSGLRLLTFTKKIIHE